ncbi:MAG TPA: hypothetical protein VNW52_11390 [Burkholderiaceae bacterium]|jgi:hypothetical protein|nr:hypothetical protein [Burkholderiaceae bacterium]
MSEINDQMDSPANKDLPTPWQVLVDGVEHDAHSVVDEVMTDSVLGNSLLAMVSKYLEQRDNLNGLRKEFANADSYCGNLRHEAKELMASLGYEFQWDQDDIGAVDAQLVISIKEAADKAAAINKLRDEASKIEQLMLAQLIDEMSLCASIVVLRNREQYTCDGEAFCIAFVATALLREKTIEDLPVSKTLANLLDWLQYSIGVKTRAIELDIYAHNRIAESIGRGVGINSSSELRTALIDAMKNCSKR